MARLAPGGEADLVSRRSVRYRELGLAHQDHSPAQWRSILSREPMLLRRPLLTDGARLVIGYNAQAYRSLET